MALKVAFLSSLTSVLTLAQSPSNRSSPADPQNGLYYIAEGGAFTNNVTYTFDNVSNSTEKRDDNPALPSGLASQPERIAKETGALYDHEFTDSNIAIEDGYMTLTIPGGQIQSPVTGAQVSTVEDIILYASVRTLAILGDPAGACNAIFFYHNDSQETDIEFLSSANSQSNPGNGSRPLHYTNQANDGNKAHATEQDGQLPDDATSAEHEYRVDWLPGVTKFFVDGVLQHESIENVPSVPGSWIWNNWANGDPGWTAELPTEDNVMKVKSIQMYYNVSTDTTDTSGSSGMRISTLLAVCSAAMLVMLL